MYRTWWDCHYPSRALDPAGRDGRDGTERTDGRDGTELTRGAAWLYRRRREVQLAAPNDDVPS